MAGSNATKSVLGELAKRVPNNQKKQFRHFLDLNTEYKKRVNKYPEKLPRIDWDYYRTNVRIEAIKMVDEFEKKYEELNKVFDDRVKLDTQKYYEELEKQRTVVQAQVKQYIAESNERVKAYEAEIERLCEMKPYSSMTMEEFINLRPECSNYIPHQRKPLFWPHDPDEQTPGPVGLPKIDAGRGGGDDGGRGGKQRDIKDSMESFETEPRKKPHPCDLIKTKIEPLAKGDDTCNTASKELYKDEVKRTGVFVDPCNVGFGKKADVKPAVEKAESKTEPESQSVESKTSHPCEIVKKKSNADNDICKSASKKAQLVDGKRTSVFFNPCNAGSGAGVKANVKAADKKSAAKTEPKLMELKKTSLGEEDKKKSEAENDPCKSTTENEDPKDGKDKTRVFVHPCAFGSHSKAADSKVKKTTSDTKPCTSEVIKPKEVKKTQPCDDAKKPKAETDAIKDKNNFTVVFADPKGAKSPKDRSKEDKNKLDKTCGALPYYNPFRSEEENRENEEKMCENSEHDDPCAKDNIEEEYYDPCKDDKYDEDK
ncbi:PREDICTED: uncharacterized protein LOC108969930 [Bactrocera latifrons]|uniref:uncharacterized protein LOC108969930 n=1 Tax=Bactrocera latifrons TaxID=174628 RepID=UPI0008DD05A6|nr:PREDICTED: uncharacterized protein LOC108969930 [Bactrocera latifrons]